MLHDLMARVEHKRAEFAFDGLLFQCLATTSDEYITAAQQASAPPAP